MSILDRTQWIDKTIGIYVGELIEYDMREGGYSIIKKENLLPSDIIEEFDKLEKTERHKAIGNLAHSYGRRYKDIPKKLIERFRYYRGLFGQFNELRDEDIFYIRKDAICVKRYCYHTEIDSFVEFREKNVYCCYMRIEPQYKEAGRFAKPSPVEFYLKEDGFIDVKGVSDTKVGLHDDGVLTIVRTFMQYLTTLNYDGALRYIVSVMDAFKHGYGDKKGTSHPEKFYRRFDDSSMYRVWQNGAIMEVEEIGEELIPYCDKGYNYRNLFLPMMNLVVR